MFSFTASNKQIKHKKAAVLADTGLIANIADANLNTTYIIKDIVADAETKQFLFTLGCTVGEQIILISHSGNIYTVDVQNARYSIDTELARAIKI